MASQLGLWKKSSRLDLRPASRGSLTCPSSVTGFIELGVSTVSGPRGPVEQALRASVPLTPSWLPATVCLSQDFPQGGASCQDSPGLFAEPAGGGSLPLGASLQSGAEYQTLRWR